MAIPVNIDTLLRGKVMKVKNEAEAVRRWNYPYDALEEKPMAFGLY